VLLCKIIHIQNFWWIIQRINMPASSLSRKIEQADSAKNSTTLFSRFHASANTICCISVQKNEPSTTRLADCETILYYYNICRRGKIYSEWVRELPVPPTTAFVRSRLTFFTASKSVSGHLNKILLYSSWNLSGQSCAQNLWIIYFDLRYLS
jgi:hypothetical protein